LYPLSLVTLSGETARFEMPERALFLVLAGTFRSPELVLTKVDETERKETMVKRVAVMIPVKRMCWNQKESEESVFLK
jgi:hypothetical protein